MLRSPKLSLRAVAAARALSAEPAAVYVPLRIFRQRAALQIDLMPPSFKEVGESALALDRAGRVVLTWAQAREGGQARSFDWGNKQIFSLGPTEVADFLFRVRTAGKCSFFHDPNMGSDQAGQVAKTFSTSRATEQGYFLNITVNEFKCSVAVSDAEMHHMQVLFNDALPYLSGWRQAQEMRPYRFASAGGDAAGFAPRQSSPPPAAAAAPPAAAPGMDEFPL